MSNVKDIPQLREDFSLYFQEIQRCIQSKCYFALLHILLAIPDVCASLETDPALKDPKVGKRYVAWCDTYIPASSTISGSDRYQMRNALIHRGSTTAENLRKSYHTCYIHFSYIDPDDFEVIFHGTTDTNSKVLNIHATALATETEQALNNWFQSLQDESIKMVHVEQNIGRPTRLRTKSIPHIGLDGNVIGNYEGLTRSST